MTEEPHDLKGRVRRFGRSPTGPVDSQNWRGHETGVQSSQVMLASMPSLVIVHRAGLVRCTARRAMRGTESQRDLSLPRAGSARCRLDYLGARLSIPSRLAEVSFAR